jgi:hypothetical protein
MTEMPFLLDKVPKGSRRSLPGESPVEAGQGFASRADLGLRHPLLENGPVQVEVGRNFRPRHVLNNSMFINNEQQEIVNSRGKTPNNCTPAANTHFLRIPATASES